MNYDNFLIEEEDLNLAQGICNSIENDSLRQRSIANALAANISKKYFQDYEVDIESGLHNAACILENIDIGDIYINGNYIDIRIGFETEALCVPAEHFKNNIVPTAYMFIELNSDLSEANVLGFIDPENIDKTSEKDGYYLVDSSSLTSFSGVESLLVQKYDEEISDKFEESILDYISGKYNADSSFYRVLIASKDARLLLVNSNKTKNILKYVSLVKNDTKEETILDSDDTVITLVEDTNLNDTLLEEGLDEFIESESIDILEETPIIDSEDNIDSNDNIVEIDNNISLDTFVEPEENVQESETQEEEIESTIEGFDTSDIKEDDEISEFSTTTTPSLNEIDSIESNEVEEISADELTEADMEYSYTDTDGKQNETIENLFNDSNEEINDEIVDNIEFNTTNKNYKKTAKKNNLALPILGIAIVIGAGAYFGITKYQNGELPFLPSTNTKQVIEDDEEAVPLQEAAMPVETIENTKVANNKNEGKAVSIPAIEKNLDASIIVANLSINWEVPVSYANNSTARRYFTKVGKIIQHNLTTEMLLLSKPPITNKITVGLNYNSSKKKFEVNEIILSSGENTVDSLILEVVKRTLDRNLNMNISSFANSNEKPVLIINF